MSNVVDKLTNKPLGEGLVKRIITWEGRKVKKLGVGYLEAKTKELL